MKKIVMTFLALLGLLPASAQNDRNTEEKMDRTEQCKKTYAELFGGEALTGKGTDPELMDILQKFIFGEVFRTGGLDARQREMITVVTLATLQTLPQLKAHAGAALRVGVAPVELREAVYQCAPFIGFPRTLNAVGVLNEVFAGQRIDLPLENRGTVTEEDRFAKGGAIQSPLYGDEIREAMKPLPEGMSEAVPRFLTEMCFGDFYTREGLDLGTRELLTLCVLTALGAERQIESHVRGCLRAGNSRETLYAAMIQCLPYVGFPQALDAIRVIKTVEPDDSVRCAGR